MIGIGTADILKCILWIIAHKLLNIEHRWYLPRQIPICLNKLEDKTTGGKDIVIRYRDKIENNPCLANRNLIQIKSVFKQSR